MRSLGNQAICLSVLTFAFGCAHNTAGGRLAAVGAAGAQPPPCVGEITHFAFTKAPAPLDATLVKFKVNGEDVPAFLNAPTSLNAVTLQVCQKAETAILETLTVAENGTA